MFPTGFCEALKYFWFHYETVIGNTFFDCGGGVITVFTVYFLDLSLFPLCTHLLIQSDTHLIPHIRPIFAKGAPPLSSAFRSRFVHQGDLCRGALHL